MPMSRWNAAIHAREDAQLLRVDLQQQEGQAAELKLLINNPGQGLLAPGRKTRAFLSYQAAGQTAVQLLFAGQVVGVAMLAGDRLATVTLTALPNQSVSAVATVAQQPKGCALSGRFVCDPQPP
jgi:hypothetical protein